jgi:predicted nucleic acid-binding protein
LIAIERGDATMRAFVRTLATRRTPILIPAAVIAEVWRGGAGHQARLARFLNIGLAESHIRIVDLDYRTAREIGILLGRASMSVTDGTVCHCALLARGVVITSDPTDIERLIPRERIELI